MTHMPLSPAPRSATAPHFIVGLDGGSETCLVAVLAPDKHVVLKPFEIANTGEGFSRLEQKLAPLDASPPDFLVGLEATGRYWENVYHFLLQRG
jgi:transposase